MTFDVTVFSRISSKTTTCLGEMKEMASGEPDSTIPQYSNLRRVPGRFRHTLPLNVMKQFQCVVVGDARGVLTVAISDQQDITVIETLSQLTRRTIFPVSVSPIRMRLLIKRIENNKRNKGKAFREISTLQPLYIHALVMPFTLTKKNSSLK
ncbi:MAG TPA: hypothetical protein VF043_06230 [Ktedonobacteraceae bacterium]